MAKETQKAKIIKRFQETDDTCTIRLSLEDPFEWSPGQFIMVQQVIKGESVRRAYSVSSSPTRASYMEITIRQTANPTMSKFLNEVQVGDEINVRGPYGRFIWTEEVSEKAVFLAAGSGITPFRAFLQYKLDKKLTNPVKLLYSCGHRENVIFDEELAELSSILPNCKYELSLTREPTDKYPEIRKGRIDLDYLKEEIKGFEDANFYVCGSPGFVTTMMDDLTKLGIPEDEQKREQWE